MSRKKTPTKHTYGSGSVFQRADGRWAGQARIGGRTRYFYGKSEAEARERLTAARELASALAAPEPGQIRPSAGVSSWVMEPRNESVLTRLACLQAVATLAASRSDFDDAAVLALANRWAT